MNHTLVIMAAGLGSRFGAGAGQKQVTPVDEAGHLIIDYSIYDAIRAGFKRVVFVIKPESEKLFHDAIGSRVSPYIEVAYAHQTLNDFLPAGFRIPEGREKPWGTGHAVLCAKEQVTTPFAVINADDFYGAHAFGTIGEYLQKGGDTCMVGYRLGNTLTENGTVSRGVCEVEDGYLKGVCEHTALDKNSPISMDATVSMNLWGFRPEIFGEIEQQFKGFLDNVTDKKKQEFYIPTVVDTIIKRDGAKVRVLPTDERWYGVTYKEDTESVREAIAKMTKAGLYSAE